MRAHAVPAVDLLVVGAGPTGLGAAHRLAGRGHGDWLVVEGSDGVGGLARSFTDDAGFTYDIGGHVLFSGYDEHAQAVDEALAGGYVEIDRHASVWMHGRYLPYPFQLHLRYLDPPVVFECVRGLIEAQRRPRDAVTFDDWIDATFGAGIARHFMRPYNRKVWATPLRQMSAAWIADRVAVVDTDRVLRNVILGEDAAGWGPNRTFRYPLRGGTGAIYEALAAPVRDRIALATPVVAVDPAVRTVTTATGRRIRYEAMLSTMPLDDLVRVCVDAPAPVRAAAARLRAVGTQVVGIGVDAAVQPDRSGGRCWVYYPEPDVPFHRLTYLSAYSPHMTPGADQTLILTETSRASSVQRDPAALVADVLAGLERCGVLTGRERRRIVTTWHHHAAKSYPVPTLDRDEALAVIEPWLADHGIASRGRFGSWRYEIGNMDHAFMQGREWVDHLMDGSAQTVWQPACE